METVAGFAVRKTRKGDKGRREESNTTTDTHLVGVTGGEYT